ncbi:hypothetical protein E0W60_35055 (plasmid) [Cupriavidus oxalaticus]|uniref:Uncharacterized protein n=1 Tax=Cupriavidus oxalaticus TaxID=96344 RepID=A0A4P7LUV9_9BURK|nr:hypothetical protein E0W60_35055 [Cupriavidus oxalaticus]
MDLLYEVREISSELQKVARAQVASETSTPCLTELKALILERLHSDDLRTGIIYYASAAELGVPLRLPLEQCERVMAGHGGRSLRSLFWAANRRMQNLCQFEWTGHAHPLA